MLPPSLRSSYQSSARVTDARRQQGDILQVAEQVRGRVGVGCATTVRELEAEHAKLKRMYADLALEHAAIKDVLHRKL